MTWSFKPKQDHPKYKSINLFILCSSNTKKKKKKNNLFSMPWINDHFAICLFCCKFIISTLNFIECSQNY